MTMELNNLWICCVFVLYMVGGCLSKYCEEQYTCQKTCYMSTTTATKCGLWGWSRCSKYGIKPYPCADTCSRSVCCKGYGGDWCDKPMCHGSLQCRNGGTCRAPDMCSCPPGFSSPMCSDINECDYNNGGCSHNCQNLFGSYMCTCNRGYMLDSDRKSCVPEDVNECDNNNGGCSHNCQNLFGSYMCTCNHGYVLDADRKSCVPEDVNECDNNNGGCSHNCQNLFGSYMCTCNHGYVLDADRKSCVPEDINECDNNNGGCNHNCQNLFGSYMCTCNHGYILDADQKSCSAETKNSTDSTNITNIHHSSNTTVVVGMGVLSVIVLIAVACVIVGIRIWPEYTYSLMTSARSKIESFSRSKIESLSRCTWRNKLLDDDEGTVYFAEEEKVEFPEYSNEKF